MSFTNVITENIDLVTVNRMPYPPTVGSVSVESNSTGADFPILFSTIGSPESLFANLNISANPGTGTIKSRSIVAPSIRATAGADTDMTIANNSVGYQNLNLENTSGALNAKAVDVTMNGSSSLVLIAGPSGGGNAGDVLVSDGTGVATWQPSSSAAPGVVYSAGSLFTLASVGVSSNWILTTGSGPVVNTGIVSTNIPMFYADASIVNQPAVLKISILSFAGSVSSPTTMPFYLARVSSVTGGGGPSITYSLSLVAASAVSFSDTEINGAATGLLKTASFTMPATQGNYLVFMQGPGLGTITVNGVIAVSAQLVI